MRNAGFSPRERLDGVVARPHGLVGEGVDARNRHELRREGARLAAAAARAVGARGELVELLAARSPTWRR